ncbi:DNA-processing protein DprA [Szabonella alba]|uniref:DNA-protecting protein DprA n=1 Tax=Szabonella alba TaxID=2804194 RepID=A0A8K0VC20_9RHOB|nr:DNA-processing protein DprA [Szabonella alba]MBL4918231.1 DNA-protecting protein DprA [Szabonella alba]
MQKTGQRPQTGAEARERFDSAERLARLRLFRSRRVGPVTFHGLIAEHGSGQAALDALPSVAAAAGAQEYQPCPPADAEAEIGAGRKSGARLIFHGEADYPVPLAGLADAPPVLWVIGNPGLLQRPMIALVGARNASSLGLRMARRLAETLGEAGLVIVSGLARGIDAEAHAAALRLGTVAVQAGGVDVIYPAENAGLAAAIAEKGCRISESPMGQEPQSRHFPQRNRIVSGLSRAVVVVEAAARSGSLITARLALDQGREVMAVPGHPFDARAGGCNQLIRDGALLVRGSSDVLEALGASIRPEAARRAGLSPEGSPRPVTARPDVLPGPPPSSPPGPQPAPRPLAETAALHSRILDRLGPSPLAEDQLIRDLALPPARIAPELLSLELEGKIRRQAGGLLSRDH